jgi:LacI family transcriptional regulator
VDRRTASLKDVAARAGVGIATVSGILNGSKSNSRVSDATRERIFKAASELDYRPNAVARALIGQLTKTVGVLFGVSSAAVTVDNIFTFTVLRGIAGGAAELGYNVMLFAEPWVSRERSLRSICDGRSDGMVLLSVEEDSDLVPTMTSVGTPVVAVSSSAAKFGIPTVDVDNVLGARLATEHLISLGHRRIAHVMGPPYLDYGHIRSESFRQTMAAAGCPDPAPYDSTVPFGQITAYEHMREVLKRDNPPTAVFAASDGLAYEVLAAAADSGISVPRQLSVIGFDDVPTPMGTTPGLTTIRQPIVQIGEAAAQALIHLIIGEEISTQTLLFAPQLVVRNTTAPAP